MTAQMTTTNTIQDIEIYAKSLPLDKILRWLDSSFSSVETIQSGKVVHDYQLDGHIPLMIVENAVGKAWTSIWFKSPETPWADDRECARSLQAFARCRVRANAAPWSAGEDMDEWWQITETGEESSISWPNAG